ncbi:hypothetical protein N2152v2_007386 [Parachlorella kessleri]
MTRAWKVAALLALFASTQVVVLAEVAGQPTRGLKQVGLEDDYMDAPAAEDEGMKRKLLQEDMSDEYASPADEMEGRRRRLAQDDGSEDDPGMDAPATEEYGMSRKLQEAEEGEEYMGDAPASEEESEGKRRRRLQADMTGEEEDPAPAPAEEEGMDDSVSEAGLGKKLRRLSQAGRRLLQENSGLLVFAPTIEGTLG